MTRLCPLLLAVTLWNTALVPTIHSIHQVGSDVGTMVNQVVEQHLAPCHLVLVTTTQHSPVFTHILRQLALDNRAGVVVELSTLVSPELDPLLQRLWGEARPTCRAVILDLINTTFIHHTLRFLERCGLWKRPEARVVVVGGRADVEVVLLHHSLRNSLHALYLALADLQDLRPRSRWGFRTSLQQGNEGETGIYYVTRLSQEQTGPSLSWSSRILNTQV
ncbi:uncharacterized protein [Panulirus ornatus]|uniref:uncharacterized protein n=1 Tax=Panulirus ornatus TaxID=150431 RepID=UPI003A8B0CC8